MEPHQAWWYVPIVPATWETKADDCLSSGLYSTTRSNLKKENTVFRRVIKTSMEVLLSLYSSTPPKKRVLFASSR
jgi:hypothetical protein